MDTRREATLQRQIEKVKRDLAALGDLRPGSLSTQYNVCGSPGCKCKADPPVKHGPYYQVSYTRKGRSRLYAVLCGICAEGLSVIATDVEQHQQETSQHGFAACMAKAKDGDTLCHQGLSTQSLDSTSIFQLCEPCNRVKAKPFGWTSSSLDPAAWQDHKHWPQSPAVVKFHTKRRRTHPGAAASCQASRSDRHQHLGIFPDKLGK